MIPGQSMALGASSGRKPEREGPRIVSTSTGLAPVGAQSDNCRECRSRQDREASPCGLPEPAAGWPVLDEFAEAARPRRTTRRPTTRSPPVLRLERRGDGVYGPPNVSSETGGQAPANQAGPSPGDRLR